MSYAWNFGDGGSATGATASRTYAAAGTYAVKLTVTDDKGATNSITKQVTVTAPPAGVDFVVDEFGRTVASGWGNADVGGPWTAAASTFSVSNGAGRVSMASAGAGPSAFLNSVSQRDVVATMDVALDKVPTGGGTYTSLIVRRIGTSDYRLKLSNTATSTSIQLTRVVSGTETALSTYNVPGLVYQVGDVLRMRLQVNGSGTTTLAAKVWKVGSAEPPTWMTTATDTTAALQNPGAVGLRIYLSGSATNAPLTGSVDNLTVVQV
ncbi:MAG: PKD domain-containing protein [Acidimicrobiia bacterium]|nr:PKD domain-containing protein [Acidimicrobiia bacterium]